MAWHERDYYRETSYGGGLLSRLGKHSVVTWLLGINCAVFVLDAIIGAGARTSGVRPVQWGYFSAETAIYQLQLWRWVTYQFFHADFFHLLFNMIGLFFFGPLMEQWWGSKRFLAFYLLCGISGAFIMTALSFIPGLLMVQAGTPLVGASGSIFGILLGAAVLFPHQRVMLLIPPIPMSMRTMALIFLGIAVFSLVAGANAGGAAAHLGGALLGAVLVKNPRWLDWADRISGGSGRSLQRWRQKHQRKRSQKRQERDAEDEAEVDRILDKVRDQGLQSLTRSEKKRLARATERQRQQMR